MQTILDFGTSGLPVTIPDKNLLAVLELRGQPALDNPLKTIQKCLLSPIGCPAFPELCKGKKRACIVVSDKTRPVPNRIIIPPILEILDGMKIQLFVSSHGSHLRFNQR